MNAAGAGYALKAAFARLAEERTTTLAGPGYATGIPAAISVCGLAGDLALMATRGVWGLAGPVPTLPCLATDGLLED
jgi:hypothetical protein